MAKRGLDQLTTWAAAVVTSAALFGGSYLIVKVSVGHGGDEGEPEDHENGEAVAAHASSEGGAQGEQAEARGEGEAHGEGGKAQDGGTRRHGEDASPASESAPRQEGESGAAAGSTARSGKSLAAKTLPPWDYRGSTGPENWGKLGEAYHLCDTGKHQSPVDIDAPATDRKLLPIRFHYKLADVTVRNDGHTVLGDVPIGNFIEVDGERYDLTQFDVHAPSEHKVAGIPYDLELHLIHKNAEGQTAVVAVLFEESKENAALKPIWSAMPHEAGSNPEPFAFDPSSLLPKKHQFYQYQGSLTTPPCSEGVRWFVLVEPMPVSTKQVDEIAQVVKFNARPVQPPYGRRVRKSTR